jgi:signal transduction histidine kinase
MRPDNGYPEARYPSHWRRRRWHRDGPPTWMHKRRSLFLRFGRVLMAVLLLFVISMGGLAFLFSHLFGGSGQTTLAVWLLGCSLAISFPVLMAVFASRAFSSFVNPLARVMAAADMVAEGDFSVRIPEVGPGEFGKFAQSFNRMVAELDRSDQLRRNLTADVAHELRTPLHIIQGNLEGILDGIYKPDPEQINLLLDETHRLARLVEDLRTLSLAEAGQLSLQLEMIDIDELLADVSTSFSGQAEAAGVSLRVEDNRTDKPLLLMGDAGRLDQVLSNLVANALRHTPSGGEIMLKAEAHLDGKDRNVHIQVSDNGEGIPEEDLPFIFERFWHGERSPQNRNDSNTGLGLPIARQLVQAHGGSIRVESHLRQGTTFSIDLPMDRPNEEQANSS